MYGDYEQEHEWSLTAAVREYGRQVGRQFPEREWILTPFDTWERNPFYRGKPGRHPEED